MREKIFGFFAVVVIIVGVLSFALMRATLGDLSNEGQAQRAVRSAVAELRVQGLEVERWLVTQSSNAKLREPFDAGTKKASLQNARERADELEEEAKKHINLIPPAVVAIVDLDGKAMARNRSNLWANMSVGDNIPGMMETIKKGGTGSSVWFDQQWLVSYGPIRDDKGAVIGAILYGTGFNDERLENISEDTSQRPLIAVVPKGDTMTVIAKSNKATDDMAVGDVLTSAKEALGRDQVSGVRGLPDDLDGAALPLAGYGDGQRAVIMAVTKARAVSSFGSVVLPLLGTIVFGLLLSFIVAHFLNSLISRPISDLEDGLLAIINGQTDIRFELEHPLLGGLVFRINSLLNQLLGVAEDDTDDEGRPSVAPSSQSFSGALNVDERMVSLSAEDVAEAEELRDEAPEDYYKRIFDEYIDAKASLGDPVDHIRFAPFSDRIKASERELSEKHGKPFRYRIEQKGSEVVFLAVPLG